MQEDYYSIGGGFVVRGDVEEGGGNGDSAKRPPYSFGSAEELLSIAEKHNLSIAELVLENEKTWRSEDAVREGLERIWSVMRECVERGFRNDGILPGVLAVPRRAPKLYKEITSPAGSGPVDVMDWVNAFALSVNEENAAGGRVVTAPTNGAAGIVPAVLHYYNRFVHGANDEGLRPQGLQPGRR